MTATTKGKVNAATEIAADPPVRAATKTAPVKGSQATVNRFLAAYIMGVANRLANGASNHYRSKFNLGMSEWRAMMALGTGEGIIVREVAQMADLDYAAASKSVRVLEDRASSRLSKLRAEGAQRSSDSPHKGLVFLNTCAILLSAGKIDWSRRSRHRRWRHCGLCSDALSSKYRT